MSSTPLPRAEPEAFGLPSRAVLAFLDHAALAGMDLHSLMLLRGGHVLAEGWWAPFAPHRPHRLHSLSKSLTSTAVGLLVTDGRLSVDDLVVTHFGNDLPPVVPERLARMRVRDLLTMRSGHEEDVTGALFAAPDGNWARAFLAEPVPREPGTHFVYDSASTFMLSALVQRLTGRRVLDLLDERVLGPIGASGLSWRVNPRGVDVGGWGASLPTEGVARFGQLLLRGGRWGEREVVPEAWVSEATRAHEPPGTDVDNDWAQGYGYQFWRCRHGAFRGDGAFGQFCVVMPEQDAVLALTARVTDMQAVLDLVWSDLLAAMRPVGLTRDESASAELRARLAALEWRPLGQDAASPGPWEATFVMEPNDAGVLEVRFRVGRAGCEVTLLDARGEHPLHAGLLDWREGRTDVLPEGPDVVLARAHEEPGGALRVTALLVEEGFDVTFVTDAARGKVEVRVPASIGRAEATWRGALLERDTRANGEARPSRRAPGGG